MKNDLLVSERTIERLAQGKEESVKLNQTVAFFHIAPLLLYVIL